MKITRDEIKNLVEGAQKHVKFPVEDQLLHEVCEVIRMWDEENEAIRRGELDDELGITAEDRGEVGPSLQEEPPPPA